MQNKHAVFSTSAAHNEQSHAAITCVLRPIQNLFFSLQHLIVRIQELSIHLNKSSILTVPDLSMHVDTCCLEGKLKVHVEPTVLCKSWGSIVGDRLPWAHVDRCICWILAHLCLKAMKPARPAIEQGLVNGWLCKDKKAEMRLQENIESIHSSTKYNIPWEIRQKQFFFQ